LAALVADRAAQRIDKTDLFARPFSWRLRSDLFVAIAVRKTQLNITLLYSSCKRTKLKTAVPSTPARNQAAQRIDETDLFAGKTMVPSESLRPA
jgi:hypothetical protein